MTWKENRVQYIFLILLLLLFFLFSVSAIPMGVILYLLLSLLYQKKI
jgi:hypothetical protein